MGGGSWPLEERFLTVGFTTDEHAEAKGTGDIVTCE